MAGIDIRHAHSMSLPKARKAIEQMAQTLQERFGIDYRWDGDVLNFARSGVDGRIELAPEELHVTAKLGFLLSTMQGTIESEIRRVLNDNFG